MKTRVSPAFFLAASVLFLVLAASTYASDAISLRNLASTLSDASQGMIQLNPEEFAKCSIAGAGSCSEWTTHTFKKIPYVDTTNPQIPVDEVQKIFRNDWDPTRFGGRSFLEHQEEAYATYPYREKDRRYLLPFANLRGWMGLNHPPFQEITQPLSDIHPMLGGPLPTGSHPFYTESFQRHLDEISGTSLTAENQVDLMPNHDSYLQKLDLIKRAKKRLWVTSMVFQCDPSSTVLLNALAERVRAGVDVRMIIEGLYADTVYRKCRDTMRGMGIDVLPMLESATTKNLTHISHNKFWIRDGEEAIIGGQNILDDENLSTGFNEGYRDTDAWIHSGPTVTDLEGKFAEIWTRHRDMDPRMAAVIRENRARIASELDRGVRGPGVFTRLSDPSLRSKGICRILSQDPGGTAESIEPFLAELVGQTRELAILTSPHVRFKPKKDPLKEPAGIIYQGLIEAAVNRGVRIDMITNGVDGAGGAATSKYRNLALAARASGKSSLETFWRDFAEIITQSLGKGGFGESETFVRKSDNIHGWNYFRFTHQKVHYFDRRMIGIGSFNLDGHSAHGNRETEMFCMDDKLIRQAEQMLTRDLANSTPIRK
jgi:phosphatidylserine/phosphatidylglycerophosphate/cardiolipin synthase-like enzyme